MRKDASGTAINPIEAIARSAVLLALPESMTWFLPAKRCAFALVRK
jgi:hypothetical protein